MTNEPLAVLTPGAAPSCGLGRGADPCRPQTRDAGAADRHTHRPAPRARGPWDGVRGPRWSERLAPAHPTWGHPGPHPRVSGVWRVGRRRRSPAFGEQELSSRGREDALGCLVRVSRHFSLPGCEGKAIFFLSLFKPSVLFKTQRGAPPFGVGAAVVGVVPRFCVTCGGWRLTPEKMVSIHFFPLCV